MACQINHAIIKLRLDPGSSTASCHYFDLMYPAQPQ